MSSPPQRPPGSPGAPLLRQRPPCRDRSQAGVLGQDPPAGNLRENQSAGTSPPLVPRFCHPPPTRGNGISSEMHLLAQPRPVPTHFSAQPRARRGGRGRSSQSPHVAWPTEGGFLVGFTVKILLCVCSTEMTCTRHQTQSGFWLGGSLSPGFHVQRCGLHPQAVF